MKVKSLTFVAILLCACIGITLAQDTLKIDLWVGYGPYTYYHFYAPGVIGEGNSSSSCDIDFFINMGFNGATNICIRDFSVIEKCGPVTYLGEGLNKYKYYSQKLDIAGVSYNAKYQQFCNYQSMLNFGSYESVSTPTFPAQLQDAKFVKSKDFYLNYIPDFYPISKQIAKTSSSILVGDYDPSILKPTTSFIRFGNFEPEKPGWTFRVETISILGQAIQPRDSGLFTIQTDESGIGISNAYDSFLSSLQELGVDYYQDVQYRVYVKSIEKMPNIAYHVTDVDGISRELVITPKYYTTLYEDGTYHLEVYPSITIGFPFLFQFYTGYSIKDQIIYVGERADSAATESSTSSFENRSE